MKGPTLETIISRAEAQGIPIAHNEFVATKQKPVPAPPFICWLSSEKRRGSDEKNRIKEVSGSLELYTDRKEDPELEEKIETEVLFDIPFQKYQAMIREENMVQTAYDFVTTEKI